MKTFNKYNRLGFFCFSIVIASIVSLGILTQSCSTDDDSSINNGNNDPKLKSLISSTEYKTLDNDIKSFGMNLKFNYFRLSKKEKDKAINILKKIKVESSQSELDKLYDEFNSIMKVDIKKYISGISNDAKLLNTYNEINNISKREYTLAVNRNLSNSSPRLKGDDEGELNACINECSAYCLVCLGGCIVTGPASPACGSLCMATYAVCVLLC